MKMSVIACAIIFCLTATPVFAASTSSPPTINRYLKEGMTGPDILVLQKLLDSDPSLYYEPGNQGYFGPRTTKAVRYFQTKHAITPTGTVGPKTLSIINTLLQFGTSTTYLPMTLSPLQQAMMTSTSTSTSLHVLIEFNQTPTNTEESLVRSYGGIISHSFHLIPVIAAQVPKENIIALTHNPAVTTLELDQELKRLPQDLTLSTQPLTSSFSLSFIQNSMGTTAVSIAVLDTGINPAHPSLQNFYAGGYNFITNTTIPSDDRGHGTHVAGIIENVIQTTAGTTGPIKLYALKVLDSQGTGFYSTIIAGLEWSVDHHMAITNNSYGTQIDPGTIFEQAFDAADKAGVLSIAAAGNSGACDGKNASVEYPAKYSSVLAVAAVGNHNSHPCFSSSGPEVGIAAPGVSLQAADINGAFTPQTGTSLSAAYVSGAAALLFSNYATSSETSTTTNKKANTEIRIILEQSADDTGPSGRDNFYGFGVVDIPKALALLRLNN